MKGFGMLRLCWQPCGWLLQQSSDFMPGIKIWSLASWQIQVFEPFCFRMISIFSVWKFNEKNTHIFPVFFSCANETLLAQVSAFQEYHLHLFMGPGFCWLGHHGHHLRHHSCHHRRSYLRHFFISRNDQCALGVLLGGGFCVAFVQRLQGGSWQEGCAIRSL